MFLARRLLSDRCGMMLVSRNTTGHDLAASNESRRVGGARRLKFEAAETSAEFRALKFWGGAGAVLNERAAPLDQEGKKWLT